MTIASWASTQQVHPRPAGDGPPSGVEDLVLIRSYEDGDRKEVDRLYTEGLLLGQIEANDTGADLDHIRAAYLSRTQDHLWVAQIGGRVIGMIGVVEDEGHVGHIRRLRVDRHWQRTDVAEMLIRTALAHCRRCGFIKVVFDTHFHDDRAVELLGGCGFQFARSRTIGNKRVLEFYINLYQQPASVERAADGALARSARRAAG